MILAVTGHRPPKVGGYNVPNPVMTGIGDAIRADFARLTPERVLTGMALGVDQWVAWICLEMDIPFTAVLPCQDFSSRWPSHAQDEFQHLLSLASDQILVSRDNYTNGCLMERNKWLVNNCETLYAVWNGVPDGGTYSTIRYAQRQGRRVEHATISAELWEQARIAEGRAASPQQELIPRFTSGGNTVHRDRRSLTESIARTVRSVQRVGEERSLTGLFPRPRSEDEALRQMEEMSRRQQVELSRRARVNVDQEMMNLLRQYPPLPEPAPELPVRSSRAEFEHRNEMNQFEQYQVLLQNEILNGLIVPNEVIRASGARIEPPPQPVPMQKQATINTEDRTTPRRFVDIGEDD